MAKITIDEKTIKHTAKLSRLTLTKAEEKSMEKHFEKIMEYVETLNSFDSNSVPATAHILPAVNVMRDDTVRQVPFDREKLLASAPKRNEEAYIVPRVVE